MAAEKKEDLWKELFWKKREKPATTMTLKAQKRGYLERSCVHDKKKNLFERSPPNRTFVGIKINLWSQIFGNSYENLVVPNPFFFKCLLTSCSFTVLKGHFGLLRGKRGERGHFPALDLRLSACEVACYLNKKEEQLLLHNPFKEQSEVALQSRYFG